MLLHGTIFKSLRIKIWYHVTIVAWYHIPKIRILIWHHVTSVARYQIQTFDYCTMQLLQQGTIFFLYKRVLLSIPSSSVDSVLGIRNPGTAWQNLGNKVNNFQLKIRFYYRIVIFIYNYIIGTILVKDCFKRCNASLPPPHLPTV